MTCWAKGPATTTRVSQTPANHKQLLSGLLTGLFLGKLNARLALGKIVKVGKFVSVRSPLPHYQYLVSAVTQGPGLPFLPHQKFSIPGPLPQGHPGFSLQSLPL